MNIFLYWLNLLLTWRKILTSLFNLCISLARSNIIHPQIVNPKVFRNEMMNIELTKDLLLPLPLNDFHNINKYYSLCKLHVLHSQDLLVFSIAIPLTSKKILICTNLSLYQSPLFILAHIRSLNLITLT